MKVTAGLGEYEIRLTRVSTSEMSDEELVAWVESCRGPRSMAPSKSKREKSSASPSSKPKSTEKEFDPSALG